MNWYYVVAAYLQDGRPAGLLYHDAETGAARLTSARVEAGRWSSESGAYEAARWARPELPGYYLCVEQRRM